jgi:hypothetical protein
LPKAEGGCRPMLALFVAGWKFKHHHSLMSFCGGSGVFDVPIHFGICTSAFFVFRPVSFLAAYVFN